MPSPPLILFFVLSSVFIAELSAISCEWRFSTCEGLPTNCSVLLYRQCDCGKPSNCASEYEGVSLRVRLEDADELLPGKNVSFTLCDAASCRVRGRACPWAPWSVTVDGCMITFLTRRRSLCCHPETGQPFNTSCLPAKVRSVDRHFKTNDVSCVDGDVDEDFAPPDSAGTSEDIWNSNGFLAVVIGIVCFVFIVIVAALGSRKKRRRGGGGGGGLLQAPATPLRPVHIIPDKVVRPEPGQPIDMQHLPPHFKSDHVV